MIGKKILVVDDEEDIVNLIAYNLEREGYFVSKAMNGSEALQKVRDEKPDLVLLDLMLPEISGLDVARSIRIEPSTASIPIIMLTARVGEIDKILGLEMGADDYVTKPFSTRELVARVRAVLRRSEAPIRGRIDDQEREETFSQDDLFVSFTTHQVTVEGRPVELTPMEFKLLKFLTGRPGRVYSRDQILDHVWGDESFVEPRTVDVHIRRLRSRIEKDPANPRHILTVRGTGYKLAES